ncbi:gliding motility-associated C-terminal domain-containing protein [Maribacter sp. ACAM166]|uniref:gliding motility-associated C-terminal domain-containing protein n=1 Tax=Maribacter sp. ACAM166 TaxID=2508996 RepID=UPI001484D3FB|nr:gliding motility-associated C-terminal domain-containing protein [Maribacter sp. ACAM166]
MGFHVNLVNDGTFDENSGRVGFFGENGFLTVSGAFRPIFYDMEVMVADDLMLEVGVGVTNNLNLILGDINTPRSFLDVNLDFIDQAFYSGLSDTTKIDGYASLTHKKDFTFPVGYGNEFKPLQLLSEDINASAKCAYFQEDPNYPTSIMSSYPTEKRTAKVTAVSPYEFWDLEAIVPSRVRLFWNQNSRLENVVEQLKNLRVVGWHIEKDTWVSLGITMVSGDLQSGTITSAIFDPQEYGAITFGSLDNKAVADLGNYLLTPNGDGVNDVLYLDAISLSPGNNSLQIYNRWGRLVYEAEDYQNNFDGFANVNWVIERNRGLPEGVYFYILKLHDINFSHQGYLAIYR